MTDLISILVLFYSVQGVQMESEMQLAAAQCESAEKAITVAVGRRKGPTVELMNGKRVPVQAATCVHACMTEDLLPELELVAAVAARENDEVPAARLIN